MTNSAAPHIVSGGSSGIGLAAVLHLLSRGDEIVILDRVSPPPEVLGSEQVTFLEVDVTQPTDVQAAARQILEQRPQCRSIIASAGVDHIAPFETTELETWRTLIDTNVTGAVNVVHSFVTGLVAHAETGAASDIITLGSVVDDAYFEGGTIYGVTSAALRTFASHLRKEFRARGVRVVNLTLGYVRSEFAAALTALADDYNDLAEGLISPDDVVAVIELILRQPAGVAYENVEFVSTRQGWA